MSDYIEYNSDNAPDESIDDVIHEEPEKKKNLLSDIVDYIEIFVFAISFVILLFSFFFRICTVSGQSMENTLFGKEKLIVSDMFYTPERNDIVVFHQTGDRLNEPVVKRVIGIEGDTVEIDYENWIVTVTDKNGNSTVLDEYYIKLVDDPLPYLYPIETFEVGEGEIFVMGDNRNHSNDSRGGEIGLVDTRRVLGKVVLRIAPLDRFGTVD